MSKTNDDEIAIDDVKLPTKRTTGDTVEERLTENAYHNILPARYLKKDADGQPVEQPEGLFKRVAKNIALAEAVYAEGEVTVTPEQVKPEHPRRGELAGEAFGIAPESRYTSPEELPDDLEDARDSIAAQKIELTEKNVSKFAYDTVVPELDDSTAAVVQRWYDQYRQKMEHLSWMPNSPTIMNAGDELQQLSACFVDSPRDDITDIHETAKEAAEIFQSGGGCGYSFSRLRPYGDTVGSTGGIASGPITFMRTFDQLCATIAQGGARRGAQMGVMRVSHPDIIQFVHAKDKDVSLARALKLNDPDDYTHTNFADALDEARELITDDGEVPEHLRNAVEGHLSNFNISVGITDAFMEAVRDGEDYTLVNPRTGEPHEATHHTKELYERFGLGDAVEVGEPLAVPAEELWNRIVDGAHENGEPGVVFIDRINDEHSFDVESTPGPDHDDHEILATNPCLTGDTEVALANGTTETLATLAENGQDVRVLCRNTENDALTVKVGRTPRQTRADADIVRVETDDGATLTCTPDHEIWTPDGYVAAGDISAGDTIVGTTTVAVPAGNVSETVSESVTVTSVVDAGSAPVYNITVDDHHNYLAMTEGDDDAPFVSVSNCGEQPLEEYEACNLGHVNLSTLAAGDRPDWRVFHENHDGDLEETVADFVDEALDIEELHDRVDVGTRFLDNVVTMSDFPVSEVTRKVAENRKVGLGIMGLAQLFIQLGVEYGSEAGNEIAREIMARINHRSKWASHHLAETRDSFANWEDSKWAEPTEYDEWFEEQTGQSADEFKDGYSIRNHNTTTIAPTGTTSMLGNTSGGCEPIFNVAYYKNVSEDVQGDEMLVEFDDYFIRTLEANDIDVKAAKREAQELMSTNDFDGVDSMETVPDAIGELFVTTGDLNAKQHAAVQCALQDGVDSAISKTTNASNDATVEDAKNAFEYVYEHGGKGVTYYRDGTRSKQVLTTRAENAEFADALPEDEAEAAEVLIDQIEEVFGGLEDFLGHDVVGGLVEVEDLLNFGDGSLEVASDNTGSPEQMGVATEQDIRDRPDTLAGVSQRIETGYGKLYVTINEDPETGEPFEVFANIGHSGGFTNSFTEAIGKLVSAALRAGVPPEEVTDELCGTRSPKVAWDNGEQIQSIPDAIGTALQRYVNQNIDGNVGKQTTLTEPSTDGGVAAAHTDATDGAETDTATDNSADTGEVVANGENPECPECSAMQLHYSEGCKTCGVCGWSEC